MHCIKLSESVVVVVDDERAEILKKQDQALKQTKLKAILVSKAKPPSGMKSLDEEMKRHQNAKNVPQVKIEPEDDATIFFTSGEVNRDKFASETETLVVQDPDAVCCMPHRDDLVSQGCPFHQPHVYHKSVHLKHCRSPSDTSRRWRDRRATTFGSSEGTAATCAVSSLQNGVSEPEHTVYSILTSALLWGMLNRFFHVTYVSSLSYRTL